MQHGAAMPMLLFPNTHTDKTWKIIKRHAHVVARKRILQNSVLMIAARMVLTGCAASAAA